MKLLVYWYRCRNPKCGYFGINIGRKTCLACGGRTKNEGRYESVETVFMEILKEIAFLNKKIKEMNK